MKKINIARNMYEIVLDEQNVQTWFWIPKNRDIVAK